MMVTKAAQKHFPCHHHDMLRLGQIVDINMVFWYVMFVLSCPRYALDLADIVTSWYVIVFFFIIVITSKNL